MGLLLKSSGKRMFQTLALWLGLVALTIQGLAPLCIAGAAGTAGAAGVNSIVICTVRGYKTVQLDADGNPLPDAPASDHGNSTCFLGLGCHMGLGFAAPVVAQVVVPAGLEREPLRLASAVAPYRPAHSSYVTRAPPHLSYLLTV